MGRRVSRRALLTHGVTAAASLAIGGAVTAAVEDWTAKGEIPSSPPPGPVLDDASRLNPTEVRGVMFAGPSADSTAHDVGALLNRIVAGDDPGLAIAGSRHSMGGQSMLRGGWVLDTRRMNQVELDTAARVMRVGSGATWRDLIPVLNRAGLAIKVMQSNHDFTVGGSLSVNCHGWHTNHPPIAGTVRSLRLLTATGDVLVCSPQENEELFGLVLGGYGLFGVILDADLEVWPNSRYTPQFTTVATRDYTATFAGLVYSPASRLEMAYGRLSVDPLTFLREAIIVGFEPDKQTVGEVLPLASLSAQELERAVFRNSEGSDIGKFVRWSLERDLAPWLAGEITRNTVMNQPAAVYADRSEATCDILHEYFVPQHRLWEFAEAAREIILRGGGELLNVTVRDVRQDVRSRLAYARQDVFGLVMNFRQARSAEAEEPMRAMTRELVDAVCAVNGTYYLPYRLHATGEQLRQAYPAWDSVIAAKHRYDPHGVFRNGLYEAYGLA